VSGTSSASAVSYADITGDHLFRAEAKQPLSCGAEGLDEPLTAMSNYVSGVRRLLAAGNRQGAEVAMERIAEQADRARQIIQRLRNFVKKNEGERRVESLSTVIEEASAPALVGIGQGLKLSIQVAAGAAEAVIDKIQQVLLNLLRNAAEAMDCSARRELSITTTRAEDMVEICVADTGPGLPELVRTKLFEPSVTTKPNGMGVGLSVCRAIVEAHGGELRAGDAEGGGTVFRLTVPHDDTRARY
jgi:two-component system, LuxR family, sensor kinase FixL